MSKKHLSLISRLSKLAALILICWSQVFAVGQEGSKSIKSEEYLDKRPASEITRGSERRANTNTNRGKPNKNVSSRSNKQTQDVGSSDGRRQADRSNTARPLVYIVDKNFPEGPPPSGLEYMRLGVTVWRLSPAQCPIQNCPLPDLASRSKGLVDTATRIEDNSALSTGERVRLGLESLSHGAFVYIIDREEFADGTLGDAYLLFPTKNINGGKNWAQPGMQIQLPRAEGCFCVKSRNPQKLLVADNLIVIISPAQLLDLNEIGQTEIPLPSKLTGFLRPGNQARTYRGSLQDGSGLTLTSQEQLAGSKGLLDTQPVLTQSDLPPQNFYQSAVGRGAPAVFSFALRYDQSGKRQH